MRPQIRSWWWYERLVSSHQLFEVPPAAFVLTPEAVKGTSLLVYVEFPQVIGLLIVRSVAQRTIFDDDLLPSHLENQSLVRDIILNLQGREREILAGESSSRFTLGGKTSRACVHEGLLVIRV